MPVYVAEYRDELDSSGPDKFVQSFPHPVLIVAGLAGTLGGKAKGGTVVAESSELMLVGTLVGRVFPIAKAKYSPPGPIMVGRTSDNDIAITEYSISKRHCYLTVIGIDVRITDCGSTNGTLVNGVPLEPRKPRPLHGGEAITLGRFALVFQRPGGFVGFLKDRR
jgi:hypothetical protein